jgi:hypothetical protein
VSFAKGGLFYFLTPPCILVRRRAGWLSGKDVSPAALVLDFRGIRFSLDDLYNCKPGRLQELPDGNCLEKEEIHGDVTTPQLVLETKNCGASTAEVAGDMTGPTADVTHLTKCGGVSGETVEELRVKGLMLKRIENSAGDVREGIITFANRSCDAVVVVPRIRSYRKRNVSRLSRQGAAPDYLGA